jgi:hypothetical protein
MADMSEQSPSFADVLDLVARGRELPFSTGSPVQFNTSDGVLCTITFDPATPSGLMRCPECGLPLPGPHRGTRSASLAMGGNGWSTAAGEGEGS